MREKEVAMLEDRSQICSFKVNIIDEVRKLMDVFIQNSKVPGRMMGELCYVSMVCEMRESWWVLSPRDILLCFLTLDFVTVKYFPVVYVASRHFIILFIFLYVNHPCCDQVI